MSCQSKGCQLPKNGGHIKQKHRELTMSLIFLSCSISVVYLAYEMGSLEPPTLVNFSWNRWELLFHKYYEPPELHKEKASAQLAILLHGVGVA